MHELLADARWQNGPQPALAMGWAAGSLTTSDGGKGSATNKNYKKKREVVPPMVPYVRAWCGAVSSGAVSTYVLWDADGQWHDVPQGEGCDQGDTLAPELLDTACSGTA